MILGSHSVVVRRATNAQDTYGNDTPDWSSATSTTVGGCSVQPQIGSEVTVGRETVVSRWLLFAPYATDLRATDRVEYNGDTYEVDGEVQPWDEALSYITALLRRSHS